MSPWALILYVMKLLVINWGNHNLIWITIRGHSHRTCFCLPLPFFPIGFHCIHVIDRCVWPLHLRLAHNTAFLKCGAQVKINWICIFYNSTKPILYDWLKLLTYKTLFSFWFYISKAVDNFLKPKIGIFQSNLTIFTRFLFALVAL